MRRLDRTAPLLFGEEARGTLKPQSPAAQKAPHEIRRRPA